MEVVENIRCEHFISIHYVLFVCMECIHKHNMIIYSIACIYSSFLVAVTRLTPTFVPTSRLATLLRLRVRHVLEVLHEVHHEPALQSVLNELITGNLSITDGRHVSDV